MAHPSDRYLFRSSHEQEEISLLCYLTRPDTALPFDRPAHSVRLALRQVGSSKAGSRHGADSPVSRREINYFWNPSLESVR